MKEELTKEEFDFFVEKIESVKDLPHPIADIRKKKLYWGDNGFVGKIFGGTLASFVWWKSKEIVISSDGKFVPDMMVSSVAHELHHAWQLKKFGPLYFIMSIPFLRQRLLEKSAIEVEKAVDKSLGMEGLRDGDPDKSGL